MFYVIRSRGELVMEIWALSEARGMLLKGTVHSAAVGDNRVKHMDTSIPQGLSCSNYYAVEAN